MSGTLELSNELCWMPAGWIYDNTLKGIASIVTPELRERLLGALTDVNGGYLDLQHAGYQEINELHNGLLRFMSHVIERGPSALNDPSFYDGYITQLRIFEQLLAERLNECG